jgi:Transposase IS116/IS110/IS902 family
VLAHALDEQIELLDDELRQLTRSDPSAQALCAIFGVGPVLAAHVLAELGDVHRFGRACQVVRLSGLDPVVAESANVRRPGRLSPSRARPGPAGRWPRRPATPATAAPDHDLYRRERGGDREISPAPHQRRRRPA